MLQFRQVGLETYITSDTDIEGFRKDTLSIDNNLPVIGELIDIFPDTIPYLGSEMAIWAALPSGSAGRYGRDKPDKVS